MQKQLSLLFHGLTMRKETENYSSKDQRVRSKEKVLLEKLLHVGRKSTFSGSHSEIIVSKSALDFRIHDNLLLGEFG